MDAKQTETLTLFFNRVFGSGASESERNAAHMLTVNNDTETCHRFLVARKWKYEKALKMLHSTLDYRKKEGKFGVYTRH